MIALGSNVHIFARPQRREELAQCFETILGSPIRTVEFPGIDQPMLIVSFPGGGHLSIEFTDDAPDDEQPRLGRLARAARRRSSCGAPGGARGRTYRGQAPGPSVLLHDSRRPGVHHRPNELNAAEADVRPKDGDI
jgi:hypothetical protein